MPFLRTKRAILATDSEVRRSTAFPDDLHISPNDPPPLKTTKSNIDLPTLRLSPSSPFNLDADLDAAVNSSSHTISVPAPPVTPPLDSPCSAPGTANTLQPHDPLDRPNSPPIQDETPKHKRFSMLRFRNASDSQLSARSKRQAIVNAHADEPAPPVPRGPLLPMLTLSFPPKSPNYPLTTATQLLTSSRPLRLATSLPYQGNSQGCSPA